MFNRRSGSVSFGIVQLTTTSLLALRALVLLARFRRSEHRATAASLAVELGKTGITVNCVCPGPILTGMTAGIPDGDREKFARRRVPLARYGDPEEVAHATLSLALPASSYINGVTLPVDGGMTIKN